MSQLNNKFKLFAQLLVATSLYLYSLSIKIQSFYGLPDYQLNKLQRVQNMCARCNESKYCLITPFLVDLHWLPVKFRIEFSTFVLKFFNYS